MLLINLLILTASSSESPPALSKVDQLRYDVMLSIDTLWEKIFDTNDIETSGQDMKLMNTYRGLSSNLSDMQVESLGPLEWELEYAQLIEEIKNIDKFFETFERLQREPVRRRHELAWTDMAMFLLERSDKGINATLTKLNSHNLFHKGLEVIPSFFLASNLQVCVSGQQAKHLRIATKPAADDLQFVQHDIAGRAQGLHNAPVRLDAFKNLRQR